MRQRRAITARPKPGGVRAVRLSKHVVLKLRPGILVLHKVQGAELAGDVVMTDDVGPFQTVIVRQKGGEPDQGVVGLLGKLPVLPGVTALDGDGVIIAVIGAVGHLVQRDTLNDLPVDADDKVAAGGGGVGRGKTGKVVSILLGGGAGIAHIVDDDPADLGEGGARAGVFVLGQQVRCDPVRHLGRLLGGGILTVASSGWQNTNVDRYLAWIMPFIAFFTAEGIAFAVTKIADARLRFVAAAIPVLFSAGCAVAFAALFHLASRQSDQLVKFSRELDGVLPQKTSVGLTGYSGLAYCLGDRRVASLNGIYSPEFASRTLAGNMARLKHDLSLRFNYWLIAGDDKFADGFAAAQGRQLMTGPDGIEVRVADWSMFDNAAVARAAGVEGLGASFFVDVGDDASEAACGYRVFTRYGQQSFEPFQRIDELAGAKAFDCGRVVFGHDEMRVPLEGGKELKIVLRTLPSARVSVPSFLTTPTIREFGFDSPLMLEVHIDGEEVAHCHVPIAEKGFSDVVLAIPGEKVQDGIRNIAFVGDHIACGYWFFQ